MLKHLAPIAATIIVLLILLATSLPLMHWFVREGREAEFAEHMALWRNHALPHYRFSIRMDCECPPPAGERVTIVVYDGRTDSVDVDDLGDYPGTIDGLFAAVRNGIDADPDTITIEYDDAYGYPRLVHIDHRRDYADDDVRFAVDSFLPLGR